MTDRGEPCISPAGSEEEIEQIRRLWREYWDAAGLPPDFQNFEAEVRSLPGSYAPPGGRLLLARIGDEAAGSAAFRPLGAQSCEAKRLYVRPAFRRMGIGEALLSRLIAEARAQGYSEVYCDTLPAMTSALRMYRELGFTEVGPYATNPTPGAVFFRLTL
jgi:ribosomal protein S18 acetylase RimI-like enzyme